MARSEIQESVLLLDDEPLILRYIHTCLQGEGYKSISQVSCGCDARAALAKGSFSIFITDVYLTDVDGRELALEFLQKNPDGRVFLMTGFACEDVELPPGLEGRVQILEKPFSSDRLLQLLATPPTFTPPQPVFQPPPRSTPQTRLAAAVC